MTKDFRNGFNITKLDQELAEKAQEINDYLKNLSNNRKEGKAETGRMAIILGHERLKEIKDQKNNYINSIEELRKKEKQYIEKLQ